MGINKKECRKHTDPGLKLDPGSGLLLLEKIIYIMRASVRNIAGRRMLVLYLYGRNDPEPGYNLKHVLFQCKDDYITLWLTEGGTSKWLTTCLDNLEPRYACRSIKFAFYQKRDEQIVTRFCNIPDKTGIEALTSLQAEIMYIRMRKRILKGERKTIERMKPVPAIPRKLQGWIHNDVLPHYIFYNRARPGKPKDGYCTACCNDVTVHDTKHNRESVCPNCGKSVTLKASGLSKNVWDRGTAQVLQRLASGELVLRIFKFSNMLQDPRNPKFTICENARIFIEQRPSGNVSCEPYYHSFTRGTLTHWVKGFRPRSSFYQEDYYGSLCGYLYHDKLDVELAGTPWQYSQIKAFSIGCNEPMEVIPYLHSYCEYPAIEYLVKLGLYRLASQLVYDHNAACAFNENGRNLQETLGIASEHLPMLKKLNADTYMLKLCQLMKKNGQRCDEALLTWYKEHNTCSSDDLASALGYTTLHKLVRYLDSQRSRLEDANKAGGSRCRYGVANILSTYRDYLEMGSQHGFDFKDSFVLFPNNLSEAHDNACILRDIKENAVFDAAIQSAYQELSEQYCYSGSGYTVIPPYKAEELIIEGRTLHHCVQYYAKRVAEGQCVVLFIRKTDDITAPYYTLELQNNRLIQVHGLRHCAPTPEVNEFLKEWERKKHIITAALPDAA